ncbi:spheroplast protein y [Shewanella sp. OPT22]|nr:spheroplast protein y [Shewanella sp. OPT22]
MKTSTKAKLTALMIAFGATSIAPTVLAGQGHDHHRGSHKVPMMKMMRKLDLTDEQKQQARSLVKTYKQDMKNSRASVDDRRAHFDKVQALVKADNFDEQAAKDLVSQNSDKRLDNAVARIKLQHDLYQLLTPEQQAKAEELKTNFKNKR